MGNKYKFGAIKRKNGNGTWRKNFKRAKIIAKDQIESKCFPSEFEKSPPKKVKKMQVSAPLQFDVKIEVEEFCEDFEVEEDNNFVIDEDSLTIKSEVDDENGEIENKTNDDDHHQADENFGDDANDKQQEHDEETHADDDDKQQADIEKNDTGDEKQQEHDEEDDNIDDNPLIIDEENDISGDKQQRHDVENDNVDNADSKETLKDIKQPRKLGEKYLLPEKNVKRNSLLRTIYDMSQKSAISVKQCKITTENVFNELGKLMCKKLSTADKKLMIEVRNSWGRVSYVPHVKNHIDSEIEGVLEQWKLWYTSGKVKETPLLYICYYCNKGWWHLNEFRNHLIEKHDNKFLKCYITINFYDCYLTASARNNTSFKTEQIDVESECWRCGGEFSFHKPPNCTTAGPYYPCTHCNEKFHTCKEFADHQGTCVHFRKYLNKIKREKTALEFYRCFVCKMILTTKALLHHHFANFHSVRSDMPITNDVKTCSLCCMQYVEKIFHTCPKKNYTITCTNCQRRFPSRVLMGIHKQENKGRYKCKICDEVLPSQCMDVGHLMEHTDNFRIVYKCVTCDENIFLMDELSMKQHIVIWHKKFYDRRRKFVETVVVPSNCVDTNQVEQLDIVSSLSGKFEIFAQPNSSGVLEVSQVEEINFKKKANKKNKDQDDSECKIIEDEIDVVIIDDEYNSGDESQYTNNSGANKTTATENSTTNISVNENSTFNTTDISAAENTTLNTSNISEAENSTMDTTNISEADQSTLNTTKVSETENRTNNMASISLNDVRTVNTSYISVNENSTVSEDTSTIQSETNKAPTTDVFKAVQIKVEKEDEIHKTIQDDRGIYDITIKTEANSQSFRVNTENDAYANLLSKVFGASHEMMNDDDQCDVNEEMEEEFEDDIIDILRNVKSEVDKGSFKEEIDFSDDDPDYVAPSTSQGKGLTKKKKKCKNCSYEGSVLVCNSHLDTCQEAYRCTKCNNNYSTIEDYAYHFSIHGFDGTKCPACDMAISKKYDFSMHLKMHVRYSFYKKQLLESANGKKATEGSIDLVYSCRECKENVDVEMLFAHWENHLKLERMSTFNTDFDEDQLNTDLDKDLLHAIKEKLLAKKEPVRGDDDRVCMICQHRSDRKNDHKRHLIEHLLSDAISKLADNKGLVCQLCGQTLPVSDKFREHLRDHAALPVFRCVICSKSFSDSSNFSKHKKTHNFHMHECIICDKKFHSPVMLQKHHEMHETTDPVKCSCCNKTFFDPTAYRKHINKLNHEKVYKCQICKAEFPCLKDKWEHMWTVHKLRKHNADCPLCSKSFRKLQDVKRHVKETHNKKMTFLHNKQLVHVVKVIGKKGEGVGAYTDKRKGKEMYVVFEDIQNPQDTVTATIKTTQ